MMSLELQRLNERLERLEKANRRLRKLGGIAAASFVGLGLFGFAAPAICDIVTGERLVIRDNAGRQRAVIDAYHTAPGLTLHDGSGRQRAKLALDDKGDVSLSFFDEKGGAKASYLFAADGAPKTEGPKTRDDKPVKAEPSMAGADATR